MEQIFFNVRKWYCLIFKKICSIEIFEKIELERYDLCLELYNLLKKFTEGNARYLRSILGILRMWRHTFSPDYQLISRQISNQLVRGHKTIGSHLTLSELAYEHHYLS